jgi:isochorismate pyruvate lyase
MKIKKPYDCNNKEEIREQIDKIDREIIQLFALRNSYVVEIVKYKPDEESVVAKDRKNEVIQQRSDWAERAGLNKQTFENIYRLLIENNISKEMEIFHQQNQ